MKLPHLDKRTAGDIVRLIIFMVVTALATSLLVLVIGNVQFGDSKTYKAVFTDTTGLVEGDDVRVAGVKVGAVKDIEIIDQPGATNGQKYSRVTFDAQEKTPLTDATEVRIRFRNLVGQRYIALQNTTQSSNELKAGTEIPVAQTFPSLDLTVLFNGFKPLFAALDHNDINKFSYEIIQVFQGQGGTLESLLGRTASVTQTLADRDQVIGALLDNLNEVLVTIGNRDDELSQLIINFRELVAGLKDDRKAILASLDGVSDLAVETADLATDLRPELVKDIKGLREVAGNINANGQELDRALQVMPIKLRKIGRTATYASLFNFYLCELNVQVDLPQGLGNVPVPNPIPVGERCDLG